ncbi:MAG TPA: acetyl-CoA carboxylase biotin carboxyl carrier protein [Candidatus Avilachnospira avistercoris]|nr:acetyl-CoA carboxylase biotin carboxyl carrier protein [Candidatus Avilachnospira avistercoris]
MKIDEIMELMKAMEQNDLTAFDYKEGNMQLSLRRGGAAEPMASFLTGEGTEIVRPAALTVPDKAVAEAASESGANEPAGAEASDKAAGVTGGNIVKSPLVGTFYSSPSPDDAPYVSVGDTVKKGQVLGIIEAMKLMNEVESEFSGQIAEILVENGEVVEYGQPLFRIV